TAVWEWPTLNQAGGNYSVLSMAYPAGKDFSYDYETFEIVPDTTPPEITLISPEDYEEKGSGNVNFTYKPYDINLDTCILYFGQDDLEANETNSDPMNNKENTFENIYFDIGIFEWNVWCNDSEGNSGFADSNFTLNISAPDLVIEQDDIWFSDESRIEGNEITIYANVSNRGLNDAKESFVVQFFKNSVSPENQIGENQTVDFLASGNNTIINESYILKAGNNNIFAVANLDESLNETSYSNNQANNTIIVELYQYFYGNVSTDVILANALGYKIIDYEDNPGFSGNLFVADADSNFAYEDLIAIGRNILGDPSLDFDDIDTNLNTTSFVDSIKEIWGGGTNNPIETMNFTLANRVIENVPIVSSTDNENFKTGILWDSRDDSGNLQYDTSDDEDLVFITELNPGSIGSYGVYDYEIRVPALLRDYKIGTNKLSFYIEIV
ncbi:MAG: trimeric autotransporter adhesin, partial [Candidatus Woesearchaeota archaeon]|nr:trimeric autotransporter adhesin [Candidatus Woesearchaeota archaeon]